jgi:uncharacterized protein YceK
MKKLVCLICIIFLSGCSSLRNLPDYIAGTYVRQPEEGTAGRYIKIIDLPYSACFDKAEGALKEMGASIRYKNRKKHTILAWYFDKIYDNCIDTTKVGVYFKEISPEKTQVDVACGNYGLAEFAATKLFEKL